MQNKIIYVGPFRFPIGDAAAARVLNNAKIFRELGYEVSFVSWGGSARECDFVKNGYFYSGFKYISTKEIDVSIGNIFYRIYNHFFNGRYSLNFLKKNIDSDTKCVIVYNPPLYFTNSIIQLCKSKNVKLISDITEWYSSEELPGGKLGLSAILNNLNMAKFQNKIQNKIVISSFLNNYYNKSNNAVIPPLVDINDVKWTNALIEYPKEIKDFEGIRFIYAGNPGKKDLLHIAIEAILKLLHEKHNLQFIIVGMTNNDYMENNGDKRVLSYKNNIIFIGRISQDLIPAYYKLVDFSILLRNINRKTMAGFPTKFTESMTCGVPVITNYTSDIKSYIDDEYNGIIVNEPSANSLCDAIKNKVLLKPNSEIEAMKKACLGTGKEFHYSNYTEQLTKFIGNLK